MVLSRSAQSERRVRLQFQLQSRNKLQAAGRDDERAGTFKKGLNVNGGFCGPVGGERGQKILEVCRKLHFITVSLLNVMWSICGYVRTAKFVCNSLRTFSEGSTLKLSSFSGGGSGAVTLSPDSSKIMLYFRF